MPYVEFQLEALVDQARSKPSPSEFADHEQWPVYQQRPDAILCLRPADKKGLPIPLMHVAFCNFTRHFHEPILDEHTPKYLTMADKLCQTMPSAFESEGDRRDAFKSIFLSLGKDLRQNTEFSLSVKVSAAEESGTRPDVANTIGHEGGHLVLLLGEFEVESTGDIYMQTCRSYEVLCEEPKNERLLRFGNPVFLLCVLGPYLMVCGAIKHENVHVEPLTPLLPMFPEFSIQGRSGQLAHCLRALREGLDALREFWQVAGVLEGTNKKASSDKLPELYLVPQCPDNGLLRFGEWQGTFESPMHERRNSDKPPCFFANLRKTGDECPRQVVVKFVYSYSGTYGTAVHRYLHSLGLAPFLYTVETLRRGLVMVVMDHLASEKGTEHWVELDTFEGKLGDRADKVRKRLERIVDHLQAKKMVHVDLRPKNIMIKVDGNGDIIISEQEPILSMIDFDWAGTVDEVLYPPFLNPKVPWPPGAKAYQKVGENHDRILLNNWWAEFVKDSPAK